MRAVVLAIDRDQLSAVFADRFHHQFAPGYQNFLIGQSHAFTSPDRGIRRPKAGDPHNGGNQNVHFPSRRNRHTPGIPGQQFRPLTTVQLRCCHIRGQTVSRRFVRNNDYLRQKFLYL